MLQHSLYLVLLLYVSVAALDSFKDFTIYDCKSLSAPSLYGIFPYAGLKFYFYEEMKRHVPEEHKNNILVKLVCGSVAGLLGQTFTYPLDVVRRQMQVICF